jgi:hypothetical protein
VVFDDGNIDCRYLLTLGVQPTTITKTKKYTGNVGLPEYNNDNTAKVYREYRTPTYLTTTGAASVTANLETGEGPGSGRFKLDTGNGNATINIYGRGSRAEAGIPCILWKGSGTNVVNNIAGDLGIAYFTEETATVGTLVTGDGPQSSAYTFCGAGCTLTTVTLNGGTKETASAITTANHNSGNWLHSAGTVTTLHNNGGVFYPTGALTITTLNLYGTIDLTKGHGTVTVTNTIQVYKGAKIIDPQGRMGNFVYKLNGCGPDDVTIITPFGKTFTLS